MSASRDVPVLAMTGSMLRALGCVAVLTLSLLSAPLYAQESGTDPSTDPLAGPAAVSLSWVELEAGCEAPQLSVVDEQQCNVQLAQWRADYQAPLRQPDLLLPALDQVLAELPVEVQADLSLWSRVWSWLREQLGGGSAEVPAWLRNWKVPATLFDWVIGLTVGACVLLALGIVGNELLQVYRSRAIAHVPGSAVVITGTNLAPKLPTFADLSRYPLQEQPSLLLQIVLNQLQQHSLLSRQAGRTHQELVQQAPRLGELGDSLADIAQAAERATYANWQISTAEVDPLVSAGERLVAQVEAQANVQSNADER